MRYLKAHGLWVIAYISLASFLGVSESYTVWLDFESRLSSRLYNLWADSLQGNGKERKREEKPVCTALNSELSSCEWGFTTFALVFLPRFSFFTYIL